VHQTKVVRFERAPTESELNRLREAGCEILHVSSILPHVTVRVPGRTALDIQGMLSTIAGVKQIDDDFEVRATLMDVAPLVRIEELWSAPPFPPAHIGPMQTGWNNGQGIRVGILDTGLDDTYPGFTGRVSVQRDYVGDEHARDGHGHGTHVAGIIGQSGAVDQTVVGMAPACELAIYKVLSNTGSGAASGIARALEDALSDGCRLVNLSLGGEAVSGTPDFLEEAVNEVVLRGLTVIVAAGNAGPTGRKPYRQTPGRAARAITVGASEKDDDVASFTSRGVTDDGRIKPNVYAPGHQIVAARAAGTSMGTPVSELLTRASGTSMAAPVVTGILASLLSWAITLRDPRRIKALVMTDGRGIAIGAEGPRILAPGLLRLPYPDPSDGVDRRRTDPVPAPPPPEESPCRLDDLLDELLRDPEARRFVVNRTLRFARRVIRETRRA
jgi:hypothetical protein